MTSSLREYIGLLLEVRGKGFDWAKFKSTHPVTAMIAYANEHLQPLGEGSARAVFVYDSRYALKIAKNANGGIQNKKEISVASDPASAGVVAKIAQHDQGNIWILSELVRPIKGALEFHQILDGDMNFYAFMKNAQAGDFDEIPEGKMRDLAINLSNVVKKHKLAWYDVDEPDHWGKTADGRVVLLDSGEELRND